MERSWKIAKEKKLRPKKEELSSTAAFNGQTQGSGSWFAKQFYYSFDRFWKLDKNWETRRRKSLCSYAVTDYVIVRSIENGCASFDRNSHPILIMVSLETGVDPPLPFDRPVRIWKKIIILSLLYRSWKEKKRIVALCSQAILRIKLWFFTRIKYLPRRGCNASRIYHSKDFVSPKYIFCTRNNEQ